MNDTVVENETQLSPLQQLQIDTGLSSAICEKLLYRPPEIKKPEDKEPDFKWGEVVDIIDCFEKIPTNVSVKILKIIMKSVVKLVSLSKYG